MKKILLSLGLAALLLSACSKNKDFSAIKNGMKSSEVIAKLGEPTEKKDMPMGSWWKYGDNSMIVISGDTVANVVPDIKKNMEEIHDGLKNLNKN